MRSCVTLNLINVPLTCGGLVVDYHDDLACDAEVEDDGTLASIVVWQRGEYGKQHRLTPDRLFSDFERAVWAAAEDALRERPAWQRSHWLDQARLARV